MARPLRVLVVDDHALVAESVAAALRASGLEVGLADLGSRDRLVAAVRALPPDLVLLDLELGGAVGDGATLVRPFVQAGARVLVMSAITDPVRVGIALEQGAVGHLPEGAGFIDLLKTALAAARGDEVTSPAHRRQLLQLLRATREREVTVRACFERLTPREQTVLRGLADGRTVAQIAQKCRLSQSVVRSELRGILTKLGVGSPVEAVRLALRHGWLEPGPQIPRQR